MAKRSKQTSKSVKKKSKKKPKPNTKKQQAALFEMVEPVADPAAQLAMWRAILMGADPDTREGVVVHPIAGGQPVKVKPRTEFDVRLLRAIEGRGRFRNALGAWVYGPVTGSTQALRQELGRVGGGPGLTDEQRRQQWLNRRELAGRVARVLAQERFPSGALRAPQFLSLHLDKL